MFQRLSIHNKLSLAIGAAILAACVLASTALLLYESHTLGQRAGEVMKPYARLVSVGAEAAVERP